MVEVAEAQVRAMKRFICESIPKDGARLVLANGCEGGPAWADLHPCFDHDDGWDLYFQTNEPGWIDLFVIHNALRSGSFLARVPLPCETVVTPPSTPAWARSSSGTTAWLKRLIEQMACTLRRIEQRLEQVPTITMQPPAAEYVSMKQAASITGLSYSKVRRAVLSGELSASNCGSGNHAVYRIARDDLLAWMKGRQGGAKTPPRSALCELVNRYFPDG